MQAPVIMSSSENDCTVLFIRAVGDLLSRRWLLVVIQGTTAVDTATTLNCRARALGFI